MSMLAIPSMKSEFDIWEASKKRERCLKVESLRLTVFGEILFWVRKILYSWASLVLINGMISVTVSAKIPQVLTLRIIQPVKCEISER